MLPLNAALPDALSPALAQAAVLILEPDFWKAPAFAWPDGRADRPLTIAERLTQDLLLPGDSSDAFYRLRLQLLANRLLDRYGRAQVLEWYLNSASFGHLAYGADSAARLYLGKSASQLDYYDAAQLVAVLEAPALNPLDAPAAAHERQIEVLARMTTGGLISLADLEAARAMAPVSPPSLSPAPSEAYAFTEQVIDQLSMQLDRARLERGGLRIITTLDYELQQQVNCTLRSQLVRLEGQSSQTVSDACPAAELLPAVSALTAAPTAPLAASAVILDPLSGQVLALAGDTTLTGGEAALSRHPAGTVQTPLLALAGFARGLSPASLVWDIPTESVASLDPASVFHGPTRLRTALTNDYRAALSSIFQQVGAAGVTTTVRSLGLTDFALPADAGEQLDPGPILSPLDLAQAFSVFSTLGSLSGVQKPGSAYLMPQLVLSVEDASGDLVVDEIQAQTRPVVSPQLAYLVQDVFTERPSGRFKWAADLTRICSTDQPAPRPAAPMAGDPPGRWAIPGRL